MSDTASGASATFDTACTTKIGVAVAEGSAPFCIFVKQMSGAMTLIDVRACDLVRVIKRRMAMLHSECKVYLQVLAVMQEDGEHDTLIDSNPIGSYAYISAECMISMMIKEGFSGGDFKRYAYEPPRGSGLPAAENHAHRALQRQLPPPRVLVPRGIGISPNGEVLYITDVANRCIAVYSAIDGNCICEFGKEFGITDPIAVCVSADGELLFVSDSVNDRILVFKTLDGAFERAFRFVSPAPSESAGADSVDMRNAPRLSRPVGVCISRTRPADDNGAADQRLYVADAGNHCVQVFRVADGQHMLTIGNHGSGMTQFDSPNGVCLSANDELLFVTEPCHHRVQVFAAASGEHVHTIGWRGAGEGEFEHPCGICVSSCGEWLLVADKGNSRIQVFSAATFEIAHSITAASFPPVDELSGASHIDVHGMCASPCADAVFVTDLCSHRVLVFSSK